MTMFAYLAIANAPLGVVSAILMLGPLGIAAWGKRSPYDLILVGIAAIGALSLTLANGVTRGRRPVGDRVRVRRRDRLRRIHRRGQEGQPARGRARVDWRSP